MFIHLTFKCSYYRNHSTVIRLSDGQINRRDKGRLLPETIRLKLCFSWKWEEEIHGSRQIINFRLGNFLSLGMKLIKAIVSMPVLYRPLLYQTNLCVLAGERIPSIFLEVFLWVSLLCRKCFDRYLTVRNWTMMCGILRWKALLVLIPNYIQLRSKWKTIRRSHCIWYCSSAFCVWVKFFISIFLNWTVNMSN